MTEFWKKISHGFHLFKDGSAWCAVGPEFQSLAVSPAGFGDTQEQAVEALNIRLGQNPWWNNKVMPKVQDFTVHANT